MRHSVERYGRAEVESWYWEVWNEPNILYWQGTPEEYHKLYDYAADGLKRALPTARIGGPHTTGPADPKAQVFLKNFLEHCLRGKNYATGKIGSPLDYVGFHAKGSPKTIENRVQMNIGKQLRDLSRGFETVAAFPELRRRPIIIGESDPEGCAACSASKYPNNAYRNGTMYSSYTAAVFSRHYELADLHKINLEGAVTWAFEFEDQPYFDGFRDLATNGIDKPVLNVFRMFGQMGGQRVAAETAGAPSVESLRDNSVRGNADIAAFASRRERSACVLIWNYHDDDLPAVAADIDLLVQGLPPGRVLLEHYRVDADHSNAYEVWKKMGSPQKPTAEQHAQLEKSGQLQLLSSPEWLRPTKEGFPLKFQLPRQGVSLVKLSW